MKKSICATGKKTFAVVLALLMIFGCVPFTSSTVEVNAAASRDTVVSYMRSMATVKWKPAKTITYWSGGSRRFYAGTTYTGMPYTQNNRQNLATFKKYVNSKGVYTGSSSSGGYVGNDCSSAVKFAWKQISSSISFGYTGNMFPGSGTGVLAVGSYKSTASTSSTKTITTKSGASTMYSAYAQLKPGDAIMARVSGVVNHTRLISSVKVVKNSNGSVNGSSSYVKCIEQCGLSSSRGNTTWNVDKTYTFATLYSTYYIPITCKELKSASSSSATGASKLAISGHNTPSSLKVGKSFSIYGSISSNYQITKVTVGIYNASGKAVSEKTVKPNSTYYSLSDIDKYIKFGSAKAGTNYYKIVATDKKTTKTLVNKAYQVTSGSGGSSSPASTLSISGYNTPPALAVGKSFSIKGTVSSNYNITSLTVGIYNANGSAVSTKTVSPNAKSYSLTKVDNYIKFGAAKAGTNYYKVKATDAKQTKTLLNKSYTVGNGGSSSPASTLAISSYNYPPTTIVEGKSFSIKGSITSNYKITSVTVGIYNANGGAVSAKTVSPNAKSYSVANVDAYIKFGAAKPGTNYYKISATDEKTTKVLVNKSYTVTSNSPASTLKLTNANYPTTLTEGKSFSIKGTITSNYKITSVTVGIYNANGGAVSAKTVNPNSTSYSIANIDAYIKFGAAKAGTNYYRISATDTKQSKTLMNQAYTVKSNDVPSTLAISGYNTPPNLKVGQSFSIKGTVTSNYTIKSVTVGIYNANGAAVSTKTVSPNSKSFNIATVDAYIKFGAAKAGTNYYKVVATDAKQTKTLLNASYTVTSNDVASTLKITDYNTPNDMAAGKSFSIKGTVSSNYNITSLTVGIYNANGGTVSAKTVNPNAKSYSIKSIDAYIKFGAAKAGTNYYRVKATDTKTTKTLVDKSYKVTAAAAASTLSVSGHNVPPAELKLGKSFSIYGTVSSNYNISSLTVGIYDSNGNAVSAKTISPNATSYSIAKIDAYIKFGAAGKGVHYYRIKATDAKQTKTLVDSKYNVVESSSGGDYSTSGKMADDIVAVAQSQIGVTGRPNTYTYWYGPIGGSYSYAWCATFVSWCANQAGIPKSIIPPECSCNRMKNDFLKLGSDIIKDPKNYNPVKGDIIFFNNYGHVGIVESYNASTGAITTIEGNTSSASQANGNTVARKTRYKNTSGFPVCAFAHPKYPASTSNNTSTSGTVSMADAVSIAMDVTSSFEGGYTALAGNSDGQGLSVGFFQWNLGQGTLQPMLQKYVNNHTANAKATLGESKYNSIVGMLKLGSRSAQVQWAIDNVNTSAKKIKDDWKTALVAMCKTKEFQAIEQEAAINWINQGKAMYKRYGLTTVRSLALCIDIAVQNWDPKDHMGSTSGKSEKQIQQMLVEAAVAKSNQKYKDDVRSRKSCIANGTGRVHGKDYNLKNEFGLTDAKISG